MSENQSLAPDSGWERKVVEMTGLGTRDVNGAESELLYVRCNDDTLWRFLFFGVKNGVAEGRWYCLPPIPQMPMMLTDTEARERREDEG